MGMSRPKYYIFESFDVYTPRKLIYGLIKAMVLDSEICKKIAGI